MPNPTELVPIEDDNEQRITLPSLEEGAAFVDHYESLKRMLDTKLQDCVIIVKTRQGERPFRTKAYWRAIGNCFKLSYEIIRDERIELDGDWGYEVTVRATDLSGRYSDGDGTCFASEKSGPSSKVHDVRAHAKTRATNRAIADLVAFGEVSYDELTADEKQPSNQASAPRQIKEIVAPKKQAPVATQQKVKTQTEAKPQTLEDHDGLEVVQKCVFNRKLDGGGDLYDVTTTRARYKLIVNEVGNQKHENQSATLVECQNSEATGGAVTIEYEDKGKFNSMNTCVKA